MMFPDLRLNLPALASITLLVVAYALPAHAQGCPPGTVQTGVFREVTPTQIIEHPVCRKLSPDLSGISAAFCSAKQSIAAYQHAIQNLNFKSDIDSFEKFEALATEQKEAVYEKMLSSFVDIGLERYSKKFVKYFGSYKPEDASKTIKTLKESLGYKNPSINELLYKIVGAKDKRRFLKDSRRLILLVRSAAKEITSTVNDVEKDPDNAGLRFLLGALQIAQANPELGALVTEIEMMESYAYLAYMPGQLNALEQLSEEKSLVLKQAIRGMKTSMKTYKNKEEQWRQGGMDGEPYCIAAAP